MPAPGTASAGPPGRSFELDARVPAAGFQERVRVSHLQYLAQRTLFVFGVLVVGFDDAVANPVPQVAVFLVSAVI
jgi:hypothetical protein